MVSSGTDWGTVPSWLALAGGSTALLTYLSARRDTRRAAAAGVYIVVSKFRFSVPPAEGDFTEYKLVNGGLLPIYDASVSVWEFGTERRTWRFRRECDWMTGARIGGRVHTAIEPGGSATGEDMPAPEYPETHSTPISPPILLIYRDGNGRQWVRWPTGKLSRVWIRRS